MMLEPVEGAASILTRCHEKRQFDPPSLNPPTHFKKRQACQSILRVKFDQFYRFDVIFLPVSTTNSIGLMLSFYQSVLLNRDATAHRSAVFCNQRSELDVAIGH